MLRKMVLKSAMVLLFFIANYFDGLAQSDLMLWYKKPATTWVEALPIGNGRIGAMIFGGVKSDRVQFNEETLWTGYPRNYNKVGAYKYLDSIRTLLFDGKQQEAEALAGNEFMGLKSLEGNREQWEEKINSIVKLKDNPSLPNYNDASWRTMQVPHYDGWESQGFEGMDGAVWFRYQFELPTKWVGKDIKLDINKISNKDYTYINGKLIGSQNNSEARNYTIPASVLKPGKNSIAILVLNFSGKGGIMGYKDVKNPIGIYATDETADQKKSLDGEWKYFIQDSDVPAVGEYQASYQPFGDLTFNFEVNESEVKNYKRELDLSNAVATTSYLYKNINYQRQYIVSQPDQTLGVHFSADKEGSISFTAAINSPHKSTSIKQISPNTLMLEVKVKDGALKGTAFLMIDVKGGSVRSKENQLIITKANVVTAWLTANTNYKNYKEITADPYLLARASLAELNHKNWSGVKNAHIKEYQNYFNRFSISLGADQNKSIQLPTDERLYRFSTGDNDPQFLALYLQYARYLLISSSRPGTRPANLQGIWNDLLSPPWGSKYTTNINLEMNYWPADFLNLSATQQPLFEMIKELSVTGTETAKQYYNAPGWVLHHNTDIWRGTAPINASNHGIWPTGGAWLCDHLWQHYLFTQDITFLRDTAYPIMKKAAEFFSANLVKDPKTQYLISTPSNSPEQGGLVAGPTMDHQIIRNLFKSVIASSKILQTDDVFREKIEEQYNQIAPNKIGRYGQLQEWMQDIDDTTNKHRHVSHLWAVYPGNEINWEQSADLMKAARQSLIYRGDAATGWSLGWKINLWARFKDGAHTFQLVKMLLSPANDGAGSYPNLFDAHPPFQIDGNFGGAAGIAEMLLQSHTQYIDLLPALPSMLSNGEINGIKVRGGFELSFKWSNGLLQTVAVKSLAGQPLSLRYGNHKVKILTEKNRTYDFNGSLQQQ